MTDTQTPERIWVVYAEGSESRDELPEVFAALEEWELEKLAKCYEFPAVPFIPFKLHAALVAERDQLKSECKKQDVALIEWEQKWIETVGFSEARPEAAQVRVKPLEWTEVEAFGQRYWESQKTPVGTYEAGWNDGAFAQLDGPSMWEWATDGDHRLLSTSDAKAAAQADYESRIRAALEPNDDVTPEAVAQLRESAKKEIENDEWHLIGRLGQDSAPADTVTGWQDISTAPLDAPILAIRANGQQSVILWGDYKNHNQPKFTHWRALPPAPEKEG